MERAPVSYDIAFMRLRRKAAPKSKIPAPEIRDGDRKLRA